tara:strand:+ start:193 stop:969 length:777 start_codon:yes stop_codon:yes gene_type:complete
MINIKTNITILILFINFSIVKCRTIELTSLNLISIRGPINAFSASKFIRDTSQLATNEINILINSPGGSVSDGNIIIEQIKSLNNSGVSINCISEFAASMAFIITQVCPVRLGISSSVMMQHQMSLGINGEINRINSYLDYISNLIDSIDIMQSRRIGMDTIKFKERIKDEWWIYGHDNVKNNILDEIIIVKCSNSLSRFIDVVKITSFFGEVILKYEGCPLVREPNKIIWNNIKKSKALNLAYSYINSPYKFIKYSV